MVSDLFLEKHGSFGSSLNPCSNGIWSLTYIVDTTHTMHGVLILVLMEYGL